MSAIALKRISQETFDDVVRENIEDFAMESKEALDEAIKQFKSQKVDLALIDLSGGIGRAEMEDAMKVLKEMATNNEEFDAKNCSVKVKHSPAEILAVVKKVEMLCDKNITGDLFIRNRAMMNPEGLNSLQLLLEPNFDADLLIAVVSLLNNLSKHSLEMRDFFEPGGSKKMCAVIKHHQGQLLAGEAQDQDNAKICLLLRWCFSLAKTASKSENNKVALARGGMMGICGEALTVAREGRDALLDSEDWSMVVRIRVELGEACLCVVYAMR